MSQGLPAMIASAIIWVDISEYHLVHAFSLSKDSAPSHEEGFNTRLEMC